MSTFRYLKGSILGGTAGLAIFLVGNFIIWASVRLLAFDSSKGSDLSALIKFSIPVCFLFGLLYPIFESDKKKIERLRRIAATKGIHRLGIDLVNIKGTNGNFRSGELAAKVTERPLGGSPVVDLWIWYRENLVYSATVAKKPSEYDADHHTVSYIQGSWEEVLYILSIEARRDLQIRLDRMYSERQSRESKIAR